MNLYRRFSLIFIAIALHPAISYSQSPDTAQHAAAEMNVDMPDETVETDLVEKGQIQLESAFLYNRFKEHPQAAIGQLMVRYGISKRLEVRVLAEDGKQRDRYMEETVQSNAPLAVGAKVPVLKDHGSLPDITLVASLKLPFTSRTSDQKAYWSPLFLVAFQNKFGGRWKLEYNGGIQQEVYSADWLWIANGSLHYKLLEPLEAFVEYYAQYKPGDLPQHNLGGGLACQIGHRVEVYISGGSTIDQLAYNHFFSGGIAIRTP